MEEALGCIPERFLDALENVAVVVEDEPNDYHLETLEEPDCLGASVCDNELLGSTTACRCPIAPTATTATSPT